MISEHVDFFLFIVQLFQTVSIFIFYRYFLIYIWLGKYNVLKFLAVFFLY